MKKPFPRRREIKRFELRRRSHHQDAEKWVIKLLSRGRSHC